MGKAQFSFMTFPKAKILAWVPRTLYQKAMCCPKDKT
jgi:hypothetical protein